jgi:hypothetical protein
MCAFVNVVVDFNVQCRMSRTQILALVVVESTCRGMANEDEWLSFSNMLLYLMKMVLSVMVFINLLR